MNFLGLVRSGCHHKAKHSLLDVADPIIWHLPLPYSQELGMVCSAQLVGLSVWLINLPRWYVYMPIASSNWSRRQTHGQQWREGIHSHRCSRVKWIALRSTGFSNLLCRCALWQHWRKIFRITRETDFKSLLHLRPGEVQWLESM